MGMKRNTYFCSAAGSLFLGSAIYILFRSESLLMFRWATALRMLPLINTLRFYSQGFGPFIPKWLIYSLPFAFWIISYMLFVRAIWFDDKPIARNFWFWPVPLISIAAELGQYPRLVPGTFDIFDLLTIVLAILFALAIIKFDAIKPRKETA